MYIVMETDSTGCFGAFKFQIRNIFICSFYYSNCINLKIMIEKRIPVLLLQ